MDRLSLIGIIGFVTVFICFLMGLFLLTVKTKHKLSNVLFALYIFVAGLDFSGFFIYRFLDAYNNWEMLRTQTSLLSMPLFYLYVLSVCYSDFRLRPVHLLHLLPFVISNLAVVQEYYLAGQAAKTYYFEHYGSMPQVQVKRVVLELQSVFYITAIFLTLKKSRNIFLENYTGPSIVSYKWLFQLVVITTVVHVIVFLRMLFQWTTDDENAITWALLFGAITALIVMCWFVLKALYQPELFRGVDSTLPLVREMLPEPESVKPSGTEEKIAMLKAYMEQAEPYLEPDLTIQELAARMNMPMRELSLLINHHLNQHFFDFINGYRIEKAKKLLSSSTKQALNVQEILYEVGFNSKSSFNTAFKKHTNTTPTQYRNSSLSGN
ncbi:AraC family transcriptional regulator [Chitinophaga lutea]|uniref:AraC family transcriptional regulator n=1 Tax=Chitinophaga lutea TaxID=2488634 RepID=A0A3N4PPY4_9BACT|nr:helix-turn-helix domain-containing protein [Chitinophaga lutea]RPE05790.1 AraC family transcriptional regulator [Chitinophaga lutea]